MSFPSFRPVPLLLAGLASATWIGCSSTSSDGAVASTDDAGTSDAMGDANATDSAATSDSATGDSAAPDVVDAGGVVTLQYDNCPTFTACGGDPTGSWHVSGGCVGAWSLVNAQAHCSTLELVPGTFSASASGTAHFDGATFVGDTHVSYTGTVNVGASCKNVAGGCTEYAQALYDVIHTDATTTSTSCMPDTGDGCDCVVTQTIDAVNDVAYTQDGAVIALSGGGGFQICTTGSTLQQEFGFSHELTFTKD